MVYCSCGKGIDKIPDWMASIEVEFVCKECPNRQVKSIAAVRLEEPAGVATEVKAAVATPELVGEDLVEPTEPEVAGLDESDAEQPLEVQVVQPEAKSAVAPVEPSKGAQPKAAKPAAAQATKEVPATKPKARRPQVEKSAKPVAEAKPKAVAEKVKVKPKAPKPETPPKTSKSAKAKKDK